MTTVSIPLTQGKEAIIDPGDLSLVEGRKWSVASRSETHSSRYYAQGFVAGRVVLMHRIILDAKPGQIVDHINGDGLDNRRANLRIATPSQNNYNQSMQRHNFWGFKGVSANRKRWRARIKVNGYVMRLGTFDSPEEAALAYDEAARIHHGEFGRYNFPLPGERSALVFESDAAMTTTATITPDLDTFIDLDRRVRAGRVRIDDARERGFDVSEWETQWEQMRNERDTLADRLFVETREGAAA